MDSANKTHSFSVFIALIILSVAAWVMFFPQAGQAGGKLPLFLPIFFALFLCRYFGEHKAFTILSCALLILLMFFSVLLLPQVPRVPVEILDAAKWAAEQTGQRALFLPQGFGLLTSYDNKPNPDVYLYDVYLLPYYFQKENYWGWFGEAAPRSGINERIAFACARPQSPSEIAQKIGLDSKIIFQTMKNCTIKATSHEFCDVLKAGAVDHVFANSNFPEVIKFAESASCLEKTGACGSLISYRVAGAEPYVDHSLNYTKKSGLISIKFEGALDDNITVRESYYPYWRAYIDSEEVPVSESEYGFINVHVTVPNGSHEIVLVYSPNKLSGVLGYLSLLAWSGVLLLLFNPFRLISFKSF